MPKKITPLLLSYLLLALMFPLHCHGEVALNVILNDDTFMMRGNMGGIVALNLVLDYDTTFLAHPQPDLRGGAIASISSDVPGHVELKVTRKDPQADFELYFTFEKTGEGEGSVNFVAGSVEDTEGRIAPIRVSLTHAGNPATPEKEPAAGEPETPGRTIQEQAAAPVPGAAAVALHQPSVLELFRDFRGERSLEAYRVLFGLADQRDVAQLPPIALSDGKTPVSVTLNRLPQEVQAPTFLLSDATFVSLEQQEKSWIITLLPREGSWTTSLLVSRGDRQRELPLAVAPQIKPAPGACRGDFLAALALYLTAPQAGGPGEGAGASSRYFHDYVFTANYLATLPVGKSEQGPASVSR